MSIGNSPEDESPSIGRTLQQARTRAGLSIDDVSTSTRVRSPIVQAIEQDDFSRCGGTVYARGHIRALARAAGVDPSPLLEQFDAEHGGAPAPTPAAPLFEAERIRPERRRPNWTAAMVAAIVAVAGFVGFTLFTGGEPEASGKHLAEGAPGERTPSPGPSTGKPTPSGKTESSESAVAAAPADKVTVKISAPQGRSWISVKDHSGRSLFDGVLERGQDKTFTDKKQVDLVLGDAGAVQLFVNGKEIEDRFRAGQVERLSYTKGDPEAG
ncbi:helix-turn-helix domain-containing protein [Streptomyces sp. NPDC007088]|uniref:helix-turn-helix domain-containing protein n=1 Tax=Streptomyces sp. NPDC007088 TaxID=3364773 RepID=UPI0036A4169B